MKYPVLALFALSVLFLAACQNNPGSPDNSSSADVPVANNAKALNAQILTVLVEGKGHSRPFDSLFVQHINLGRAMGSAFSILGTEHIEKVTKMRMGMKEFTEPYELINVYAIQLDSLSTRLNSGRATLEEAQKEFSTVRKQMQEEKEKLSKAPNNLEQYRTEFEAIFTEANRKAAGGQ
ncbi:MAG: hypothetical protein Q7T20_15315 [Saprospiraceae bacterium]|nr:hypothetical protein [Saprospiraceae bacterium]